MNRLCSLLLCAVLLVASLPVSASADGGSINVYNWGQYISDGSDGYIDVNKAFTEETGITVNYMTFDSNESMYTKLKTGGSTYDVIIPSDYMIAKLISEGMLEKLDFSNIPNYRYIDKAYRDQAYDPKNEYSVPYTWGTVGVIYNSKYVDEKDIGSWDLLWNPKYSGKILMFDNPRDAFAIGELKLGYSLNTEDRDDLRNASYELIQQKPISKGVQKSLFYSIPIDMREFNEAPVFPGGTEGLYDFLVQRMDYSVVGQSDVVGVVLVEFDIEADGSVANAELKNSLFPELDKQALRIVKEMPHWQPALKNGSPVRCRYLIPFYYGMM